MPSTWKHIIDSTPYVSPKQLRRCLYWIHVPCRCCSTRLPSDIRQVDLPLTLASIDQPFQIQSLVYPLYGYMSRKACVWSETLINSNETLSSDLERHTRVTICWWTEVVDMTAVGLIGQKLNIYDSASRYREAGLWCHVLLEAIWSYDESIPR